MTMNFDVPQNYKEILKLRNIFRNKGFRIGQIR